MAERANQQSEVAASIVASQQSLSVFSRSIRFSFAAKSWAARYCFSGLGQHKKAIWGIRFYYVD
jgi:hypothetical protein